MLNCDGLAVYLMDWAMMAERMWVYPAAKIEPRGATGSLLPRIVRGNLADRALECPGGRGSWLARLSLEGGLPSRC